MKLNLPQDALPIDLEERDIDILIMLEKLAEFMPEALVELPEEKDMLLE